MLLVSFSSYVRFLCNKTEANKTILTIKNFFHRSPNQIMLWHQSCLTWLYSMNTMCRSSNLVLWLQRYSYFDQGLKKDFFWVACVVYCQKISVKECVNRRFVAFLSLELRIQNAKFKCDFPPQSLKINNQLNRTAPVQLSGEGGLFCCFPVIIWS